jgi:hypothetical protein
VNQGVSRVKQMIKTIAAEKNELGRHTGAAIDRLKTKTLLPLARRIGSEYIRKNSSTRVDARVTKCYRLIMTTDTKKEENRNRKERVLHTRVPEILEKELKRLSESLRLPVSNIVRAVLEDALEAAEYAGRTVQEEAWNVAERFSWLNRYTGRGTDPEKVASTEEREAQPNVDAANDQRTSDAKRDVVLRGVIGFQPLTLARSTTCSLCGRTIVEGENGYLGVRDRRGPQVIIGEECMPKKER